MEPSQNHWTWPKAAHGELEGWGGTQSWRCQATDVLRLGCIQLSWAHPSEAHSACTRLGPPLVTWVLPMGQVFVYFLSLLPCNIVDQSISRFLNSASRMYLHWSVFLHFHCHNLVQTTIASPLFTYNNGHSGPPPIHSPERTPQNINRIRAFHCLKPCNLGPFLSSSGWEPTFQCRGHRFYPWSEN